MKRRTIIGFLLIALPVLLMAEIEGPQRLTPALDVPLGPSCAVFGAMGRMRFGADYRFPFLPMVCVSGGLGYDYVTAKGGVAPSAFVTSLSLGGGLRIDLLPWLSATIGAGVLHGRQRLDPG
jgi:hypothetical protein